VDIAEGLSISHQHPEPPERCTLQLHKTALEWQGVMTENLSSDTFA
jgi:hypothetical protein